MELNGLSFLLSCIVVAISSTKIAGTMFTNHTNLKLVLFHRNSILSPFHNPNMSISDRALDMIQKSESRLNYLHSTITGVFLPQDGVREPLMPHEHPFTFLVNISIGERNVPQLLLMDTGSSLTWVRSTMCTRCQAGSKNIFNPRTSATYSDLSCNSHPCRGFSALTSCDDRQASLCKFNIKYGDQTNVSGILASEMFTFTTSTDGIIQMPNLTLGCAREIGKDRLKGINGILGLLGNNPYALPSQFGGKFSYCLGSIKDTSYVYNQLVLGEEAALQGYSTPMQNKGIHNYISLEGISVGEKVLEINQNELFKFDFILDSGSEMTYLPKSMFKLLAEEVRNLMDGLLNPVNLREGLECYEGNMERDLKGFPVVTLHLANGADLDLDVEAFFFQATNDAFCMAVLENEGLNIIGVLVQQNYNIGFDLNTMTITFQRIDCELLED